MSGKFSGLSQAAIERRIKEGRGQRHGADYKPWINTYDVSSSGRSHRIFGFKSQRLHHLLSDLELSVFLMLDWSPNVIDIREQFPLRVDDTLRLAEESGITHRKYKGVAQVLTSDFLVDTDDRGSKQFAIQAKYCDKFSSPETISRLELERRYWKFKCVPWYVVTENEISKSIIKNTKWLYPAQYEDLSNDDLHHYLSIFSYQFEKHPDTKITQIAQSLDVAYQLEIGTGLYWLRQLLARRYFIFDIQKEYLTLYSCDLLLNDHDEDKYRYAAS